MSPADLADDADEPQNQDYKIATITRTTNCLYLRNNAACCIPLRNLRHLRENIHMRVLNLLAQRKPQCLPQISQMTQTNHKTQSSNNHNNHNNQPVFICEIMQLAAFLCVICVICGRITRKRTQSIRTMETHVSPADLADLADDADKPQNNNNHKTKLATNCLYLRNNAALLHSSA